MSQEKTTAHGAEFLHVSQREGYDVDGAQCRQQKAGTANITLNLHRSRCPQFETIHRMRFQRIQGNRSAIIPNLQQLLLHTLQSLQTFWGCLLDEVSEMGPLILSPRASQSPIPLISWVQLPCWSCSPSLCGTQQTACQRPYPTSATP